jgi:excisionase family DNA binding protein
MSTQTIDLSLASPHGPCPHSATAICIDVVGRKSGKRLQMHSCGRCRRSWWKCDGTVIELSEALGIIRDSAVPAAAPPVAGPEPHPDPEPAAFLALLSWVGHSIGTDLVLFAVVGPAGWRMVDCPRPGTGANREITASTEDEELASSALALRDEALLDAVADQRRPTEITQRALAGICPRLVVAGVRCVVGAPIYAPSGHLAAVILAAYRDQVPPDQLAPLAPVSWTGRDTVGCMGKLLATAHRALRAIPAPAPKFYEGVPRARPADPLAGDPNGFLRSRDVASVLAVSPRTIANWARAGALPATRTDGGHLRFRRGDVLRFFEGRTFGRRTNDEIGGTLRLD